jgi:hypothetical protein
MFYVDKPNAKPVKIVLQHVLGVPACGTNNLLSIIQLMRGGVNFNFQLDGATASHGSVLVYEVPLINSLFVLRTSTTSLSVSKASVGIEYPPNTAPSSVHKISEAYSHSSHAVDRKDILVWHARLAHLSFPAIEWLPNEVRGIKLRAESPSTCICEAYCMGNMFRKPFEPSDDTTKTRLLQLIHFDVIGSMQTKTMRGYRYMIMCTDDRLRYINIHFMKVKSETPAKFKEYVAKVEKQHPKLKVSHVQLMEEASMLVVRSFLSTWQRKASLGIISPILTPAA